MTNLANKIEEGFVFQAMGEITKREGDRFVVRALGSEMRAKRAVGCLVEPREGDRVLLAGEAHGACFVISVLEREDRSASITCEGDLDIKLKSGRFRVASQEGIDLVSPKEVSIAAGSVSLRARAGSFVLEQLSYLGSVARAELERIKVEGGILETVMDRVSQRVKRSFRTIEEIDQVNAERIDYAAKQTMTLRGENTLVTARELVKMDGEQIHMG